MLVSKNPCGPNTNPYRPNANPNQPNANPNTSRWKMVIAGFERDGFTFGNSISDAVSGGIWALGVMQQGIRKTATWDIDIS